MSNTPILDLPVAPSLDGSEYLPLVQSGTTKRATATLIANTASGWAPTSRAISTAPTTSTGLTGGGSLAHDLSLALSITGLTAKTAMAVADAFAITDVAGGNLNKQTTFPNAMKAITGLSSLAIPSLTNDYMIINHAADGLTYKISPSALSLATGNVPAGGTTGQLLKKNSGTNYDTTWINAAAGSNTQLQFNSSNVLGASANLTWDGTTLSTPLLTFPSALVTGARQLMIFSNNEAPYANFGMVLSQNPASNGALRNDNVLTYGYNVSPTGRLVNTDQTFFMNIESNYKTSEAIEQMEFYFGYGDATGAVNYRPFSITPILGTNFINIASRGDAVIFGASDFNNDWLRFSSSNGASGGTIGITGNTTQMTYVGAQTSLFLYNGHQMLGESSGVAQLASGYSTAALFGNNNTVGSTLVLNFGGTNTRGLRYNGSSFQFEFQTGPGTWQSMAQPTTYWLNVLQTGIGPVSFVPDGSATLHVYDATPTTGRTRLKLQAGAGSSSVLWITANDGSTDIFTVNQSGNTTANDFRTNDAVIGVSSGFSAQSSGVALGTAAGVAFSSTVAWTGTIDTRIARSSAGIIEINNGSGGTLRDLTLRNLGAGIGPATTTFIAIGAGTSAKSQINLATGGPPAAPVDGDIWREDNTNTGLKVRINGVTKTVTVS